MDNEYFKSDLTKILVLTLVFVALFVILAIWDNKSGVLEEVAGYWL